MTPQEVAERIDRNPVTVELLLLSEVADGYAERDEDGCFRLSRWAEQNFGPALRGLTTKGEGE